MTEEIKMVKQFLSMRAFLVLTLLLIICIPSRTQTTEDIRNKEVIALNKVKNQISWDYKYSGEKPEKTGVKTSVTTYSAGGDISQVIALNPKGAVLHTEKYNYDSRGNKTEYTRNSAESSYQKKYAYNEKNQLTEESGFDGVENFRNLYNYNAQGELIEIRYMKKTVLQEKRVFAKNNTTTTVSVFNAAGSLTSKLLLKYDARGNLVEEVVYGINQSELEKKTYHYDDKKNLKEEAKYKLDKITLKTSYNYNASGALMEISEEAPGVAKFVKKSLSYNDKGSLLEIKWRRKGTEEFNRITYQYDERGLCTSADTYYPATKYRVLTKYTYEYFN
jgi:competence protein ComGC